MLKKTENGDKNPHNDWLYGYTCDNSHKDYPNILYEYTSEFILNGEDHDRCLENIDLPLPNKNRICRGKRTCGKIAKSEQNITQEINQRKKICNIIDIISNKNRHRADNIIYQNDIEILAEILSLNNVLSDKFSKQLAIKLITCFGSLELALEGMENSTKLTIRTGISSSCALFLKNLRKCATAVALCHVAVASPSSANEAETGGANFEKIESLAATAILRASRQGTERCTLPVDNQDSRLLSSERDVLIGLWWVYWSMTRMRDSLASSGEISFTRCVLTQRTSEHVEWLRGVRKRCREDYTPHSIRMAVLPKSDRENRLVPVISLEDKVALMTLYASCYDDLHRIDSASSDYSYKFPCPSRIHDASQLNYVPRAFLYKYLQNYLSYTHELNSHINNGRYVFQTDIQSFVHCISPDLLYHSMIEMGFDEAISRSIFNFHKAWNDQNSHIGVPFGNSLTTAGMKIVLCRIHAQMKSRGCTESRCFSYADDFALVGDTFEEARDALRVFDSVLEEFGLQRNQTKTLLRCPHEVEGYPSVDAAIGSAFAEVEAQLHLKGGKVDTTAVIEPQESLTLGGETEPAIEFFSGLATVPQPVLRSLYLNHVKPNLDQDKKPKKGITNYTLYRMIKCKMSEAKEAIPKLYQLCPYEQHKILGWLTGTGVFHYDVLKSLIGYYSDKVRLAEPWLDYSRSIFVLSMCRAHENGDLPYDKDIYTLVVRWWFDPDIGYLTRRELHHFIRISRLSFSPFPNSASIVGDQDDILRI